MRPFLLRLVSAIAALSTAQLPALAHADDAADDLINPDRPGIADGSNVVGAEHFQVETGFQFELRNYGDDRTLFVPTLLRLGLDQRWELRFESNTHTWHESREPGQPNSRSDGWSPASIGVKYHMVDSAGVRQPSLGTILRIFPPSGSGDFRTHHTTGDLRLAADWDFAPHWSLNPNVGVAVYEDGAGRLFTAGLFAATLTYNPSKVLSLFVDTGVQAPEAKNGRASVILDAGVACIIGRDVQLDLSAGTGAAGDTPPHPFLSAGISKRF